MMEKQKCRCNGSRGTDCDWCGGSGWKTDPIKLDTTPLANPFPEIKQITAQNYNPLVENTKYHKPMTFDERIKELNSDLKKFDTNLHESAVLYFRKRIDKLNYDINNLKSKVQKQQRKHFKNIKAQSDNLINEFDKKFKISKPIEKMILVILQ